MKNSIILACYTITLGSLLSACGAPDQEASAISVQSQSTENLSCATKALLNPGDNPLPWPAWRTRVRDELLNPEITEEVKFGVEVSEEISKPWWDPLNGTGITSRNTCTRAFVIKNNVKTWLEAKRVPGRLTVSDARLAQNYVLLSGQVGSKNLQNHLVLLSTQNGQRTTFASVDAPLGGCNAYLSAHPSPSGAYIAQQTLTTVCGPNPEDNHVAVQIFDSAARLISGAQEYSFHYGAQLQWLSETEFELNDGDQSFRIQVPAAP